MGSQEFVNWVELKYSDIQIKYRVRWLLKMDYDCVQEFEIGSPGMRIELLCLRSITKYQPIDVGLVAISIIRCTSNFQESMINAIFEDSQILCTFLEIHSNEFLGVWERFLRTIGDDIEIYYESCHIT